MSHFVVLCVTQTDEPGELEQMLAPYDEELEVEQFTEDGETYWRNPNAKWDWWTVGGRWSDRLLLNDGRKADSARIGDVALDTMVAMATVEVQAKYDRICDAAAGTPPARTWKTIVDEHQPDYDRAREVFRTQPRVQAVQGVLDKWDWDVAEYIEALETATVDAAIRREALARVLGRALLTAEGWMEKGQMGWFGMGTETADSEDAFHDRAWNFLQELPDDWYLTVVDCHI